MVGLIKGQQISLQDFQSAWPKGFTHHLSVQLNSLCSHLTIRPAKSWIHTYAYLRKCTHTCTQTHTRCLEVSEYFLLMPPLFFYQCSLSKIFWRLHRLTQTSPRSLSFSADKEKVGQIPLSLTIWRLRKWQRLSRKDTIKATIKDPCTHFHGCYSHSKLYIAHHGFENEV